MNSRVDGGARSRANWDLIAGALLISLGGAFLYFGWNLRPGTLSQMGPGYLPRVLSIALIALGVAIAVASFGRSEVTPDWPSLRPFIIVVGSPILFGLLIGPLGLVLTIVIVTSISRLAEKQAFGWDAVVLPVFLAAFCVLVFVYFINLPLKLWP